MVQEIPENQQNGKKEPKIHCYPAIGNFGERTSFNGKNSQNSQFQNSINESTNFILGPMGEMGKVYRGELPPEHILPPRPKPGTIMPDQDPAAVFERPKIEPQVRPFEKWCHLYKACIFL